MYKCTHFKAYELVPKKIYEARGEKAIELLDKELLVALDYIRENLGKVTINNWKFGGLNQYRGIRTPDSKDYRVASQHSWGKAADFDVDKMTAEEVRQWIIANRNEPELRGIGFIEMGVSWVHIDTRPTENDQLLCYWLSGKTDVLARE